MRLLSLIPLACAFVAACGAPTDAAAKVLHTLTTPAGVVVSFQQTGHGPTLVLVHGAFSDHDSNWQHVRDQLARDFTVVTPARRNRGATARTHDHSLADEGADLATLLATLDRPAFVVGHSYGAHVALLAAAAVPERVARLVLYEPPRPDVFDRTTLQALARRAAAADWPGYATTFFGDGLRVPATALAALQAAPEWRTIVADAPASAEDVRALAAHAFAPERFRDLQVPVLLQVGEHSPPGLYVTDALARALPNARVETLAGEAHEAMTTSPELWTASVVRFLRP
jgi:pimeloyl-ACP methyl ester carboxylesterase